MFFGYKYGMFRIVLWVCIGITILFSNSLYSLEVERNTQFIEDLSKANNSKESIIRLDPEIHYEAILSSQKDPKDQSYSLNPNQEDLISLQTKDYRSVEILSPEEKELSNNTSVIKIDNNPVAIAAVEKSITLFTEMIKNRFSLWLSRSGKYLDLMKDILRAKNLPEDIAFLPLIESGFNPVAYSVARAVGPWQFITATAKRYGLKIDWWRDERRDPVKSTVAAADYLKDLYDMFGSWNLAMAAYNAGEGKILKALNKTKKDDFWELLSTKYIKKETKEYVPRFIAARMIAANPDEYGFDKIDYHPPFEYDEVVINHPLDLDLAAEFADTSVDVIRELNPELRRWSTPPGESSYSLRIPVGKKETFLKNLSETPQEKWFSIEKYRVKKGDTIKKIAKKTGIPVTVILELNNGLRILKVGDTISLPPKDKYRPDRDDIMKASSKARKKKKSPSKVRRTSKKRVVIAAL